MSQNKSASQPKTPEGKGTAGTKAPQPGIANQEKDPKDWVTGEEPMTGAQASYLKTLCEQHNQTFTSKLSKADASRRIDELRKKSGVVNAS